MTLREQLVHVSRRVERGELLIAREGGHDPDFELIEVHIAQLRAFASADDGPIFLGHALERRVAQEYARRAGPEDVNDGARRSEEHTSELQSLMRNSYAFFGLK